ncbi:MAG: NAD(P)/FAD-dependent oxidoreductase [Clostridia bacterium]|nr:NAD(P)/FAD-dependent oxidoreductase [Clostridia bacterium]
MEKIIVIGANQTGLVSAWKLGEAGFDVTVYEAKSKDQVAYDWYDDIDPLVFGEIGLPMPDKSMYFNKKLWTFVNPSESVKVFVQGGAQANDISIERRPLNDFLLSYAEKVAKVNYGVKVDELIISEDSIKGVIVRGEKIFADLVVDTSGVYSKFRTSLPESFKMDNVTSDEVFVAFRGFFERVEGEVDYTNKAYLKHQGQKGISWAITTDEDVDILIGRVGKLPKEQIDDALASLKKDNPALGEKLVKCGYVASIPVRYPSTMMVANGYVTVGDSAYMTIPMMGSGVVAGMIAATYLAEVLTAKRDFSKENLWNYQVKFYEKFGGYVGVDVLKRWLLACPAKDVDFLFEKRILCQETLSGGLDGSKMKLPLKLLLRMVWNGKSRLGVLLGLAAVMGKMDKAKAAAYRIPKTFDEKAIAEWRSGIEKLFE